MTKREAEPTIQEMQLLTSEAVAGILCVTPETLEQWRHRGKGPRYYLMGRSVRYRPLDVLAWQQDHLAPVCPRA